MKILIFYQYFGTPSGGWSTRYYEFTRRWVKAGHSVTVVTSPYYKSDIQADGFISRKNVEGVELIVVNSPDSNKDSFFKRAWNAFRFSIVSIYFALSEDHDLVLSSSGPITTAVPGLFSKWIRGKKLVFEVRDLWPKGGIELGKLKNPIIQRIALGFEKIIYQNSSLVVACSGGMEQGVKNVVPEVSTLVISNSSDVELFSNNEHFPNLPQDFDATLPIFIYAGSLGLMDDCSQILEGLRLIDNLEYNVVFIGDGAERNLLERLCEDYGLHRKVWFLGLIPKTEVVKWFGLARASFVTFKDLPVLGTNSPNKMFDSFAAGVPIIQSTRGWIANLVNQSSCGINVDPTKPKDFADAIQLFLENPDLANEMGRNAKALAENDFNRTVLSNKFLAGLNELVP
ncbi:glycosyltransferase family 4 protein [Algoriphagus vanfongensis]|uniref:glycosyltransferase family 4 protein n=1 Tax=Algoriphagus vanfongensis TaxID=426371 RepID=UPI000421D937|nr:glycosyltransferase family 4 protein [Algoriphagus vanfongensis]